MYIVKAKVKDYFGGRGLRVAGGSYDALNRAIAKIMADAAARAKANGRKTVMAQDF